MPTLILMAILEQDWHLWAEDLCLNANYAKKKKKKSQGAPGCFSQLGIQLLVADQILISGL